MSESRLHSELIQLAIEWIEGRYRAFDSLCIFSDASGMASSEKPPTVNGHKPDVFAVDTPCTFTVIGEAKTTRDLETDRSHSQLASFLTHLQYATGPMLVLAVPFNARLRARAIIQQIKAKTGSENVPVEIIDKISLSDSIDRG